MKIPGFTAGASIYITRNRYSGAGHYATLGTGVVMSAISFHGPPSGPPNVVRGHPCFRSVDEFGNVWYICCDEYGCHPPFTGQYY